jgi:PAS domain S-box-containing protein
LTRGPVCRMMTQDGGGTGMNILLIDHDAKEARWVEQLLQEGRMAPYEFTHLATLAEGLKFIEHNPVDIVILALNLPDARGLASLNRLARHSPLVPVVVAAAEGHDDTAIGSLREGAQDYLNKPSLNGRGLWRALRHAIERKQLQIALRNSQERFELVIKGSTDGTWDWSFDAQEVYFSSRWKEMFGFEDHEISNDFKEWEKRIHPEDLEYSLRAMRAYLQGLSPQLRLEHRMQHRDGTYRWILARGVALRDSNGRPYRMAGTHVDITEIKAQQEALRLAHEHLSDEHERLKATQHQLIQAEKVNSIGRLAAGIAHEIKNPLATISMGVEFLNGALSNPDENLKLVLTELEEAVKRADIIARGLLEYSAPLSVSLKEDSLPEVIDKALLFARHELAKKHIRVVRELESALPLLELDRNKMIQVLLNLFINAVHAMEDGGLLTVRAFTRSISVLDERRAKGDTTHTPDPRFLILEIEDTGTGIPEEYLQKIFDPFFTTKPTGKGTGLGLAVARSILELHGAGIELANVPGGGARATVRFLL